MKLFDKVFIVDVDGAISDKPIGRGKIAGVATQFCEIDTLSPLGLRIKSLAIHQGFLVELEEGFYVPSKFCFISVVFVNEGNLVPNDIT